MPIQINRPPIQTVPGVALNTVNASAKSNEFDLSGLVQFFLDRKKKKAEAEAFKEFQNAIATGKDVPISNPDIPPIDNAFVQELSKLQAQIPQADFNNPESSIGGLTAQGFLKDNANKQAFLNLNTQDRNELLRTKGFQDSSGNPLTDSEGKLVDRASGSKLLESLTRIQNQLSDGETTKVKDTRNIGERVLGAFRNVKSPNQFKALVKLFNDSGLFPAFKKQQEIEAQIAAGVPVTSKQKEELARLEAEARAKGRVLGEGAAEKELGTFQTPEEKLKADLDKFEKQKEIELRNSKEVIDYKNAHPGAEFGQYETTTEDGQTIIVAYDKRTGETVSKTDPFTPPVPPGTTVVEIEKGGKNVNVLVDKNTGKQIADIGPSPRNRNTQVVKNLVNGKPKNLLIDKSTGKVIKDIGEVPRNSINVNLNSLNGLKNKSAVNSAIRINILKAIKSAKEFASENSLPGAQLNFTPPGVSDEVDVLRNRLSQASEQFGLLLSGQQVSDQQRETLHGFFFPKFTDSSSVMIEKLTSLENFLKLTDKLNDPGGVAMKVSEIIDSSGGDLAAQIFLENALKGASGETLTQEQKRIFEFFNFGNK